MIDNHFRNIFPKYVIGLLPTLKRMYIHPNHLTLIGFFFAILSAYSICLQKFYLSILMWWISRIFDALDGVYARKYSLQSPFGAYFDILLDMASYSLIIISLSYVFVEYTNYFTWILFGYVLCITSALAFGELERDNKKTVKDNRGLKLGAGLAEGGETGIAYTIFLLFPSYLHISLRIWIVVLMVTVVSRSIMAYSYLKKGGS